MSEHSDVPAIRRSRIAHETALPVSPRAWVRRSVVAPVAVVVLALAALVAMPQTGASADTGAASVAAGASDSHAGEHLDLRGDTDEATAAGARGSIPTWRGSTLTYFETLPAKWSWSLDSAVAKWNASGSRIRLVPTTKRSKAQFTIGYGDTQGAAGLATVGRTRNAWVRLSPTYDTVDALDPWYRVEVLGVLAHEIGHVLGFQHTAASCSLMAPVLDVVGCGMFSLDQQGWYRCRTIDAPLATRFVRLYGGRARLAPTSPCLIDPMPSALRPTYRLDTRTAPAADPAASTASATTASAPTEPTGPTGPGTPTADPGTPTTDPGTPATDPGTAATESGSRTTEPVSPPAGTSDPASEPATVTTGVDIAWTRPAVVPDGSQVEIRHWSAPSCQQVPTSPSVERVAPGALAWSDDAEGDALDTCYQAVLANRYGVFQAASPVMMRPLVAAAMQEPTATVASASEPQPAPGS